MVCDGEFSFNFRAIAVIIGATKVVVVRVRVTIAA